MTAITAVFGLMIGSFANVLALRFDRAKTIVTGRSACPHCDHALAWFDLVPVLSFIFLQGKCRYCRKPISWQYPAVELLTMGVALHSYYTFGLTWQALVFFVMAVMLLVAAVIDIKNSLISDSYSLGLIALAIAFALGRGLSWQSVLWAVLLAGGLFAVLVFASKERWMGAGDIGLAVVMGIAAGFPGVLVGLVVAFVGGSLVGLFLLALRRKTLKMAIPFGPFLAAGIYVSALYGQQIMQWYLDTIGFY